MLTIIGAALVAVALIILYAALEGLRRKEEELDKEIKEVEMRVRDFERLYVDDIFDRDKDCNNRISRDDTIWARIRE